MQLEMPNKEQKMQTKATKKPKKAPKEMSGAPKSVKTPQNEPRVTYVYRKDAFKKVKIA
jgi:hypothetical protein